VPRMTEPLSSTAAPTPIDVPERPSFAPRSFETLAHGRYRITDLLGEGGMSSVYGAYDALLERSVAIKMLRLDRDVPALEREARILAAVRHPNVVVVYALHNEERPPFLVMERIDGISLDRWKAPKATAMRDSFVLLRGLADGLDAIHHAGLIHGDVKPSNVLIDRDGDVKLIDVGLVPMLERMKPGQILGTPAYIAPERALGTISPRAMAPRSDVYSFAVLAFELLTGTRPFDDDLQAALLDAHATRVAPRPSEVSSLQGFDATFERALSKTPAHRPASAGAMMDELERIVAGASQAYVALRILVVDDDVDVCALLSGLLASRLPGSTVEAASGGLAAIAAIERLPRSVALFDLAMPGLARIALIREVRARAPSLPIIVCSGLISDEERRDLAELGVQTVLDKPVTTDTLLRAIRASTESPAPGELTRSLACERTNEET
jgi:serine/threonine protein kinase